MQGHTRPQETLPLEIIILAAGKGTRMRSRLPKVLHPIGGRPMIRHVLDRAHELKARAINIIVGHGAAPIKAALAGEVVTFIEQQEQLGTGHAVQQALPKITADTIVLLLYGDVPLISTATLESLVALVSENSIGLLTAELADPSGYGRIVRNRDRQVCAIVEHKDATVEQRQIREINSGIMAVGGGNLLRWIPKLTNNNAQGEYYLTDIIALAQAEAVSVKTLCTTDLDEIAGVNDREQQAQLERAYQRRQARQLMSEGLTLLDPHRFDLRGSLKMGMDCVIDVNCVIEGEVVLGDGVTLGPNCYLKNATVGSDVTILANTLIEDAIIADECNLGPFARLRPGTRLDNGAKIGNFVETKNAHIGTNSKINHLSYVGDASLGSGVNIGAGTITCNYDGVNKSHTEIADNVFVGSNTALVAPVTVAAGATVAAGSTVTGDIGAGQLGIARARQRNIDGWRRPVKKTPGK
jgi:bifunctional UDP-N-acetylglucosamine pyrophosphorylase/glucosamine-1-phosphate N-acetyltransferase